MRYARFISGIFLAAVIAMCTSCGNDNDNETENASADSNSSEAAELPSVNDFEMWAQDSEIDELEKEIESKSNKVTTVSGSEKSKVSGSSKSGGSASTQKNGNASKNTTKKKSGSGGNKTTAKTTVKTTAAKTASKAGNKTTTAAKKKTTAAPKTTEPAAVDDTVHIKLNGSSISSSENKGVSINGSTVTISSEGKYEFAGTLDNGQIIVNADKSSKVDIYFNGVSVNCGSSAPLYVMSADTCSLHLVEGSSNYVQDSASNAQSACIYSKDDLTIKGSGSLTVYGNKKHGIKSSNDVKIKNGSLRISSVSAGIYGDDSVQVSGGSIVITSCKDGIKAANEQDASRGFVTVEDGYIDVQNAAGNGIQAISYVDISGGTINIHSAKKSVNCDNVSAASGCICEY